VNVTKYAIRHRLSVYFLILILCLGGVGVYVSMPRESFPEVEVPFILVYTIYPGVSPTDMETLVTRPIETELKAVSGIKEISSTTSEGLSSIAVEFNPETDLETALASVREKVDLAKSDLPPEAEDPRVQDMDFSQVPIMMITLSGPVGSQRLTEVAEEIQEDLEALPGVNRVNVIGGRVREVHVQVDPKRLAFFELSLSDVVVAVARENRNVPGGEVAVGGLEYLVRLPAEVRLPSEIEDFVIKVRDGEPVFVRDVADVVFGFEDESSRSRVDQEPSVTLSVEKRTGANLVSVADLVNAELGRWDEMLPEGISTAVVGDISVEIRRMVNELENNVISGLLLVVGCLMAFVGLRNSFFVGVAIPLSMMASFLVLGWIGYSLNMMVLFSLILMLGMLVDNAVVIVENIYRHREHGDAGPDAAYEATAEVARPVIASTITTLCAFSPLLIWPGIIGDFMSYLPVTLIIGLTASLVVALIINPTLCAHLMKPPRRGAPKDRAQEHPFRRGYRRLLEWSLRPGPDAGTRSWFLRNWALPAAFVLFLGVGMALALTGMFFQTNALLPVVAGFAGLGVLAFVLQGICWLVWSLIRRPLRWSPYLTDHRSGWIWMMCAILVGTVGVYTQIGKGVELFPEVEPRQIAIDVETTAGSSLDASDGVVQQIEELTTGTVDMKHQVANVGSTGVSMNPGGGGGGSPNRSQVTLYLHERADRQVRNTFTTMESVRAGLANIVGANIKVDAPQDGPPTGAPVSVRILGDDLDEIERLAEEVKARIRGIEGLVNLDDDLEGGKPELRVEVDREEAMRSGVDTQIIAATVQTGILGAEASKYRVGEDEHDIRIRLAPEARASLDDIGELTVPDDDGIPVPIRTVAELKHGVGPAAVRRVDLNRVATIEGDVVRESGRTEASVREEVAAELDQMAWPPGYRWEFSGANQEEQQATAFLSRAFVIALLLILMVLVTQFDSLILPLTIITSVALSVIGVLWGLMLTGTAFGIIMTGIGVISLAGIVVNNAIVLCDFVRQLRERGLSRHDAVVEAGSIRLRPVLLTAVTTVLGLVPLTLGLNIDFFNLSVSTGGESSQFWASMGVAVIFGLTVATVLTLVVVPVTYDSLDSLSEAIANYRAKRQRTLQPAQPGALNPAGP
jgi:multidrug efflux pump subunit AcrB